MFRNCLALLLALTLIAFGCSFALADDGAVFGDYYYPTPRLSALTHNCPNTGKMLPETFNPNVTSYILTVASWVSRVSFTPTANDPNATIRVNGVAIRSGAETSYFKMTDHPQQVTIEVSNGIGQSTVYTVFLQRRPSEKRTRVSAGYITEIYQRSGKWYINADLGTVTYGSGNMSTFVNKTKDSYKYACTDSCIFYFGSMSNPNRAYNINDFKANYNASALYRFIYIEDEIVAVLPYSADY
ncbi:MAG: cadherin-like beta sandwich domain-containing protein [Clostridia bacterium]|nr:cadherin-like beta sandwich domain-containing protein [Clostridia bacterium]